MTTLLNARILASLGMIVFVAAIAASSTGAFFSDTETSTGNTFTAGDIDLQIDNESYITNASGVLVASATTSWAMADLVAGTHHFFDFDDVKPGDVGEDTISLHVGSNNAYLCAAARLTTDSDNGFTEPEDEVFGTSSDDNDGTADGDLDSSLNFAFWKDDGDNVKETDETVFLQGPLSNITAQGNKMALADSSGGPFAPFVPGDSTVYIGKAWCYGAIGVGAIAQDGQGKLQGSTNGPLVRGTGVTCDGSTASNIGQTDQAVGDLQFYATQARNNGTFTCATNYTPFPQQ